MSPEVAERLRGFLAHAAIHALRGNRHAVVEALEDAARLLAGEPWPELATDDDHEVVW